jgi:hypothetical protein
LTFEGMQVEALIAKDNSSEYPFAWPIAHFQSISSPKGMELLHPAAAVSHPSDSLKLQLENPLAQRTRRQILSAPHCATALGNEQDPPHAPADTADVEENVAVSLLRRLNETRVVLLPIFTTATAGSSCTG